MPPSASKQKRLAEKAAKGTLKAKGTATSESTPGGSENGNSNPSTPLTSLSANASTEDLKTSMAKLAIATDR